MKKRTLSLLTLFAASALNAAVTINGSALRNTVGLSDGDLGVYIVSLDGTAINSSNISIASGADLTNSATYGASFAVFGTNTASEFIGTTSLGSGHNFDLVGGIDTSDAFGIITFETSTTTAIASDTFRVWTAGDWDIPVDGSTEAFDTELTQLDGVSASSTGSVVPEPSTYGFLAGLLSLGFVFVRRK